MSHKRCRAATVTIKKGEAPTLDGCVYRYEHDGDHKGASGDTWHQGFTAAEQARCLHRRNEHTAICEHCSERDYPDYAVPWPCPTIRALNGEQP